MSPIRTRAYRERQRAERDAEAAAAEPAPAPAVNPTAGPSLTSTSMRMPRRETSRPPVRKMSSGRFFHITREDGEEHMILIEHSPVGVLVQPRRPGQLSSKGSPSSSCMATSDKPVLSAPSLDLEITLASGFQENVEIDPDPRLVRQRRLTIHCPLTVDSPQCPEKKAPSSLGARLIMDYVQVPPRRNLKRRNTCSLAGRDVGQSPVIASTITCRHTCPLEPTTSPDHCASPDDEIPAKYQAEASRPKRGCYLTGFLVFCCLTALLSWSLSSAHSDLPRP